MPPLTIDTSAAARCLHAIAAAIRGLEHATTAVLRDAAAGDLVEHAAVVTRTMREMFDELSLTGRVLGGAADAAMAADELAASLGDGVGAVPLDLADPGVLTSYLLENESIAFGHFGHLPLFGVTGEPSPDDVNQGHVGDCFLLAALAAIAHEEPAAIRRMITDHGNGTYTVHLPNGDVTVDDELPVIVGDRPGAAYAHQGPSGALWPAIVEKAVAVAAGGDYAAIDGLYLPDNSFDHLIAAPDSVGSWREAEAGLSPRDDTAFRAVVDDGRPAVALSFADFGFGSGHAWTVVAVTGAGASAAVTLRNPWGRLGMERDEEGDVVYDAGHLDIDDAEVLPEGGGDGIFFDDPASLYITLSADVFRKQFFMVHTASPPVVTVTHRS